MAKILADLALHISADVAELKKGLAQANTSLTTLQSNTSSIGGKMMDTFTAIGRTMMAAFAVERLISFTKECMNLAAKAEGVNTAFAHIGGSIKIMEDLKKATRGALDDSDLAAFAVKAHNFNIPLKDLSTYLEFATNRAITTGESVDVLVEKILMGVGRKSPKAFVALGISAKESSEWIKSGKSILDLFVLKLAEMGPVADTAETKLNRLNTSVIALKESWGAYINQSRLVQGFTDGMTKTFDILADKSFTLAQRIGMLFNMDKYDEWKKAKEGWMALQQPGLDRNKGKSTTPDPVVKEITNSIDYYTKQIGLAETAIKSLDSVTDKGLIITLEREIETWKKIIDKINDYSKVADMVKSKADYKQNPLKPISDITIPTFASPNPKAPGLQDIHMDLGGQWTAGAAAIALYIKKLNEAKAAEKAMMIEEQKQGIMLNTLSSTMQGLGSAFGDLAAGTKGAMKGMVTIVLQGLQQVIDAYLAVAIAATVKNDIEYGGPTPIALILAATGVAALLAFWQAKIPSFASGGFAPGGLSLVGERGPELVNLPHGSQVFSNSQSAGMMGGTVLIKFQNGSLQGYMDYSNRQRK